MNTVGIIRYVGHKCIRMDDTLERAERRKKKRLVKQLPYQSVKKVDETKTVSVIHSRSIVICVVAGVSCIDCEEFSIIGH